RRAHVAATFDRHGKRQARGAGGPRRRAYEPACERAVTLCAGADRRELPSERRRALSHVLDPPGGHAERCCLPRSELVERARARACRGRSDATRELTTARLLDAGARARCGRVPNRRRAARRCGRNGGAEEWLEIAAD